MLDPKHCMLLITIIDALVEGKWIKVQDLLSKWPFKSLDTIGPWP
jgi:hypothetical protein